MNLGTIEKAPADVLDYDVEFAGWLAVDDIVDAASATIADSTAEVDAVDVSDDRIKVWISGGADGDNGTLTLTATTSGGRTKEVCLRLRVKGC